MSFPVRKDDGEVVQIVDKLPGAGTDVLLVSEDGDILKANAGFDALKAELVEAGEAAKLVADEANEAVDEVVEEVRKAGDAIEEDVSDLVDAVKDAADEFKDAVAAAGDAINAAAADPVGTAKDVLDWVDGDDDPEVPEEVPTEDPNLEDVSSDLPAGDGGEDDGTLADSDAKA